MMDRGPGPARRAGMGRGVVAVDGIGGLRVRKVRLRRVAEAAALAGGGGAGGGGRVGPAAHRMARRLVDRDPCAGEWGWAGGPAGRAMEPSRAVRATWGAR